MSAVDLPPSDELEQLPPEFLAILRDMRVAIERTFEPNMRDLTFARLGALVVQDATPGSVRGHIAHLKEMGVTGDEMWAVLFALVGQIGMPRLVSMLPTLLQEIGPPSSSSR